MPGRPGGSTNVGQDFRAECLKTGLYAEAVRNDPGKKMDFRRQAKGYVLRDGKLHKLGNGKSGRPLQNKLII